MRLRVFAVLALAVGLTLLLALAIAAQETGGTDVNQAILDAVSAGPTASPAALQNRVSLGHASAVTFTPALTTYLPAVFRDHPYCATIPALIRPADGGDLDTRIPLFTWDSGNDPHATDLYLEIWRDAQLTYWVTGLKSGARTRGIHQWRINLNLDPATTHRWRAFLMCGSTQGPYSEVRSFTTGSGGTVLPAPNLLSPANGSLLPGPGPGGTEVTLKWAPVSGAVEYQVTHLKGWFLRTTVVTGTEATLHLGLDTAYEWWVQARNDYAWSAESAHWRFTTPGLSPTFPPPTSSPGPKPSPRPTPGPKPTSQGTTPVPPTSSPPRDVSWSTPSRPVRVARFNFPRGIAIDPEGNLYVADMANRHIRKITPDGAASLTVTTLAGSGEPGGADGPAGEAQFRVPEGVAADPDGNVVVADTGNHRIRRIVLNP